MNEKRNLLCRCPMWQIFLVLRAILQQRVIYNCNFYQSIETLSCYLRAELGSENPSHRLVALHHCCSPRLRQCAPPSKAMAGLFIPFAQGRAARVGSIRTRCAFGAEWLAEVLSGARWRRTPMALA